MIGRLKYLLLGSPLPTEELAEKRLNKVRALAAFSPDALSSIAYANQEIYLGLLVAGAAGLALSWQIGLVIAGLLAIVAISYHQTIHAYPSGGGSYAVARENLGTSAGLITAAALLLDYILTAAVSLTAGVEAIASAFPVLWSYRVHIALLLLFFIMLINLRGARETGSLMAIPVYFFLFSYLILLTIGLWRAITEGPGSLAQLAPPAIQPLTLFLILHTFSSGSTALTGIEAISNGVPAFKAPEAKNAGRTLIVMAFLMGTLFLGSLYLTQYFAVIAGPQETILSALARRVLGSGFAYLLVQFSTMLILAVAANTSFAGAPRLSAILASEGFLPRQLSQMGDRLVFANGIVLLSLAAGALIIIFGGKSHALIPLFAVGVFLAFTLSQLGMVLHWYRERGPGWVWKTAINGIGAIVTCLTLIVVGVSKFLEGAWIIILFIPIIVFVFSRIHNHYQIVANQLSLHGLPPSLRPVKIPRVVVPISGVHRGIFDAINFARSISSHVTGVYIEIQPGSGEKVRKRWQEWWPDIPLDVVPSPYRSIIAPLLDYLDHIDQEHHDGQLAVVVLPEFIPANWWQSIFHNQTAWLIRAALLYRRRHMGFQRIIIDVPYHLKR